MLSTKGFLQYEPLVSVVTPFYNTAEYLAECIESVLAQTYTNFEYVLLDNCSDDGSTEIARSYATKDSRLRLIVATEFVNQVENYNRALQCISPESKFTKIVQADDWILPQCLREMVMLAETDADIVVLGAYSLYRDKVGHDTVPFRKTAVFDGKEATRFHLLADDTFLGSPTCVMYRSECVRNRLPFFALDCPCEDIDACLDLLQGKKLGFVFNGVLSFNRRDNQSIWAGVERFKPERLNSLLMLKKYGPRALDSETYATRLREVEASYYAMLGRAVLTRSDTVFWRYHEQGLRSAWLSIDRWRVFRCFVNEIVNLIGNPKQSLGDLWRWLRARRRLRPRKTRVLPVLNAMKNKIPQKNA